MGCVVSGDLIGVSAQTLAGSTMKSQSHEGCIRFALRQKVGLSKYSIREIFVDGFGVEVASGWVTVSRWGKKVEPTGLK
jgi:hypothetical protein